MACKNIVVVGGNGYLGAHVAKYFGADVLSRRNGFDITDPNARERIKNYDVIIHMAAKVDKSGQNPEEVFRVNADGTRNLVQHLRPNQTLLFASTKEVYNLGDSYSYSKSIAEKWVEYYSKRNGFRAGIFRLATTYAPNTNGSTFVNRFLDCVRNGDEIRLKENGKQVRDFLYVDDLSGAIEKFIDSPEIGSGTWDIGGGKLNSLNFLDLVNLMGAVVEKVPVATLLDEKVDPTQLSYITSLEKINLDLSWMPKISVKEGIEKLASSSS